MKYRYSYADEFVAISLDNILYYSGFFVSPAYLSYSGNGFTVDSRHPRFGELEKILKDAAPIIIESQECPLAEIKIDYADPTFIPSAQR